MYRLQVISTLAWPGSFVMIFTSTPRAYGLLANALDLSHSHEQIPAWRAVYSFGGPMRGNLGLGDEKRA